MRECMAEMEEDRLPKLIISYKPRDRKLQDLEKDISLRSRNGLWPLQCTQKKKKNLYYTSGIGKRACMLSRWGHGGSSTTVACPSDSCLQNSFSPKRWELKIILGSFGYWRSGAGWQIHHISSSFPVLGPLRPLMDIAKQNPSIGSEVSPRSGPRLNS